MIKSILVGIIALYLLTSLIPFSSVFAEPLKTPSIEQTVQNFLAKEYGAIDVVNQQSYPTQGDYWVTGFVTTGTHDLIISGIDGTSFWGFNSDVTFVELYDGTQKLTPFTKNNKLIFPNFSSDNTSHLKVKVNSLGAHHLKLEFGSDVAFSNNTATASSTTLIASGTNGGPTLVDSDNFGIDVTNMGDINNDGTDDLAVGAYRDDTGGSNRGAVYILFMNTDGSIDSTVEINDSTTNGPAFPSKM